MDNKTNNIIGGTVLFIITFKTDMTKVTENEKLASGTFGKLKLIP